MDSLKFLVISLERRFDDYFQFTQAKTREEKVYYGMRILKREMKWAASMAREVEDDSENDDDFFDEAGVWCVVQKRLKKFGLVPGCANDSSFVKMAACLMGVYKYRYVARFGMQYIAELLAFLRLTDCVLEFNGVPILKMQLKAPVSVMP